MKPARYLWVLAALAALLVTLAGVGCWALFNYQHDGVVALMLAGACVYAVAGSLVLRAEAGIGAVLQRRAVLLILGTALLCRLLLIVPPPVSTDVYRYIWDGRMQAAGINPYRYKPADPQLHSFQDEAVFSYINRADSATTIYPPFAQVIFVAVTRIGESVSVMKAAMVGFECLTVAALWWLLKRRGLPPTRLLFYAWHPLPMFEFAGSGHIDAAAIGVMLVAFVAAERRRPGLAGALLGLATLVKFFPLVVFPALYRRWDWRLPLALAGVIALLYVPYLGVGWKVLGFLPGYIQDEGLAQGAGFFLLNAIGTWVPLPPWAAAVYLLAAAAILAALALRIMLSEPRDSAPLSAALKLLSVFMLLLSPHFAWYFAWIIPFLCVRPSWALIYLTAAAPILYANLWVAEPLVLDTAMYVPFALILLAELIWRSRSTPEISHDSSFRPRTTG